MKNRRINPRWGALTLALLLALPWPQAAWAQEPIPYWDGGAKTIPPDATVYQVTHAITAWAQDGVNETWYYVPAGQSDRISIGTRIEVTGTVRLLLGDRARLWAVEGIHVGPNQALHIYGQSAQAGALQASGQKASAAIGGNDGESCGTVAIHSGDVTANSVVNAGIGGGKGGAGGSIAISGGKVTATGIRGAGIGGGEGGGGGKIAISGGMVDATSFTWGAGIGGGVQGGGGEIAISGGQVTALSGAGAGIGGGSAGASGDIAITGAAVVTATGGNGNPSRAGGAGIGSGGAHEQTDAGAVGTIAIGDSAKVTATGGAASAGYGKGAAIGQGGGIGGDTDGAEYPDIAAQPQDQAVKVSENATFEVEAANLSDGGAPDYQWQELTTESGATWNYLPYQMQSTFTVYAVPSTFSGRQYRCLLNGMFATEASTLTVRKWPLTAFLQSTPFSAFDVGAFTDPLTVKVWADSGSYPNSNMTNQTVAIGSLEKTIRDAIGSNITNSFEFTPAELNALDAGAYAVRFTCEESDAFEAITDPGANLDTLIVNRRQPALTVTAPLDKTGFAGAVGLGRIQVALTDAYKTEVQLTVHFLSSGSVVGSHTTPALAAGDHVIDVPASTLSALPVGQYTVEIEAAQTVNNLAIAAVPAGSLTVYNPPAPPPPRPNANPDAEYEADDQGGAHIDLPFANPVPGEPVTLVVRDGDAKTVLQLDGSIGEDGKARFTVKPGALPPGEYALGAVSPAGTFDPAPIGTLVIAKIETFHIGIRVLAVRKGASLKLPKFTGYGGHWTVKDEGVAKLTHEGTRVKAVALGTTQLIYTAEAAPKKAIAIGDRNLRPGDSYEIMLNVRARGELVTGLVLDVKKLRLNTVGATSAQLTPTLKPKTAPDQAVFYFSSKPGVATVDQAGRVTAVSPGKAKITAVSASLVRRTVAVTVSPAIAVKPAKKTVKVGKALTLTATLAPGLEDQSVGWSSSDEAVATVEGGVVVAIAKGKATITATASNGEAATAVITVKKR